MRVRFLCNAAKLILVTLLIRVGNSVKQKIEKKNDKKKHVKKIFTLMHIKHFKLRSVLQQ